MEKSGFRIQERGRNGCSVKYKGFFAGSHLGMHKKSK